MTKSDIQKSFPGAKVFPTKSGFGASLPNGINIQIDKDAVISIDTESASRAYGIPVAGKTAVGSWQRIAPMEGLIQLAGNADSGIAKVAGGVKDAVTGETEYQVRRSLGYSPYIVGEK